MGVCAWVTAIATVILAVATVVLAVVTGRYARLTREILNENRKQCHNASVPFVAFRHSPPGDNANPNLSARHKIVNEGVGAAIDVDAEVLLDNPTEGPPSRQYRLPALRPGGQHELFIPMAGHRITRFGATYTDVFGRVWSVEQQINDDTSSTAVYLLDGKPYPPPS